MDNCKLEHGSEFCRFRTCRNRHNHLDVPRLAWGTQTAHTILLEVDTSYCVCYPKSCQIKHTQTQWHCQGNGFVCLQWTQLLPCPYMRLFSVLAGYQVAYLVATMVSCMNGCYGIFSNFQYNVYSQGYPNFQQQQPYIEAHLLINEICHVKAVEYVKAVVIYKI